MNPRGFGRRCTKRMVEKFSERGERFPGGKGPGGEAFGFSGTVTACFRGLLLESEAAGPRLFIPN